MASEDDPPLIAYSYKDGQEYETPDGFLWLQLPETPTMFGLFAPGGDATSRALVCRRCGALVAFADAHTAWHDGKKVNIVIRVEEDLPAGGPAL